MNCQIITRFSKKVNPKQGCPGNQPRQSSGLHGFRMKRRKVTLNLLDQESGRTGNSATRKSDGKRKRINFPKSGKDKRLIPYKCSKCGFAFQSNSLKQRHMELHSGIGRSWICSKCGCAFKMEAHLRNHETRKHATLDPSAYKCLICDIKFKSQYNRREHMKIHERTEQRSLECTRCPSFFTTSNHLHKHLRTLHGEAKPTAGLPTLSISATQSKTSPPTMNKLPPCKVVLTRCDSQLLPPPSNTTAFTEGVGDIKIKEKAESNENGEAKSEKKLKSSKIKSSRGGGNNPGQKITGSGPPTPSTPVLRASPSNRKPKSETLPDVDDSSVNLERMQPSKSGTKMDGRGTTPQPNYKCPYCFQQFHEGKDMIKHLRIHQRNLSKR